MERALGEAMFWIGSLDGHFAVSGVDAFWIFGGSQVRPLTGHSGL